MPLKNLPIAAEVDAVAAASGVTIPGGAESAALAVAASTAANFCSMLVDVRRGLKTEVEQLWCDTTGE